MAQLWTSAAEAAKVAADAAASALRTTHSIADIQGICGHSRDLFQLLKSDDPVSAAAVAFELREQTARLHATKAGREMASQETWDQILSDLGTLHNRLETAVMVSELEESELERVLQVLNLGREGRQK